jgi:hypothetical protein
MQNKGIATYFLKIFAHSLTSTRASHVRSLRAEQDFRAFGRTDTTDQSTRMSDPTNRIMC